MARVTLSNVCKSFDKTEVVRDISLEIRDREFLVLVGPSGCGKSTLLRMIAGLEDLTAGKIRIGERKVNDLPPKDRDIAMVFQNYALYPHMNVQRNMGFGLKMRGFDKQEIDKRVQDASQILKIEDLLQRKPSQLSGGQRQRVAMGRAIVRKPAAFLFDEPLSNLDAKLRVQMRLEIKTLHQRLQSTIIYVTHDQVEAMTLADRVAVMHQGILQQVASSLEVYNHPANLFVAGFLGSPPINLIHGEIRASNGALHFSAQELGIDLPAKPEDILDGKPERAVVLGIRPEHLRTEPIPKKPYAELPGRVELAETMGSEVVAYVRTGPHLLSAVTRPEEGIKRDMELKLYADTSAMKLFDPDSGINMDQRRRGRENEA